MQGQTKQATCLPSNTPSAGSNWNGLRRNCAHGSRAVAEIRHGTYRSGPCSVWIKVRTLRQMPHHQRKTIMISAVRMKPLRQMPHLQPASIAGAAGAQRELE
jgi:hypothetical protein